jgi:hypothetical protein
VLLFGVFCCLAVDADPAADKLQAVDLLVPDKKELAMDQSPAETKHWWYGHKYDWDKKKHGEHGEHWQKPGKLWWWWKWH